MRFKLAYSSRVDLTLQYCQDQPTSPLTPEDHPYHPYDHCPINTVNTSVSAISIIRSCDILSVIAIMIEGKESRQTKYPDISGGLSRSRITVSNEGYMSTRRSRAIKSKKQSFPFQLVSWRHLREEHQPDSRVTDSYLPLSAARWHSPLHHTELDENTDL